MQSFPPEILGEIFEACLSWPLFDQSHPNRLFSISTERHAPILLALSHVCTSWRDIASSTPTLWNNLAYTIRVRDFRKRDEDFVVRPAEGLSPWLSFQKSDIDFLSWWAEKVRSDSLTLKLRLQWGMPSNDKVCPTLGDYLTAARDSVPGTSQPFSRDLPYDKSIVPLLELVSRARYLDIDGWYYDIFACYLSKDPSLSLRSPITYPNLEFLSIHEGDWLGDVCLEDYDLLPIEGMSKLKMMDFNNYVITDPIPFRQSPLWGQLAHLTAGIKTSLNEWLQFLKACTSLESACFALTITDSAESTPSWLVKAPFDLPNLRNLEMRRVDYGSSASIFDGVHFPSLEVLALEGPYLSMESLHRILKATPELKNLRILMLFPVDTTAEEDEIISLTGDLELIGHIHFPLIDSSIETGNQKNRQHSLSHYVPKLEILGLALPFVHCVYPGTFTSFADEMLKSGWLRDLPQLRVRFHVSGTDNRARRRVEHSIKALQAYLAQQDVGNWDVDEQLLGSTFEK